jgi:hypothetical protein
VFTLDEGDEQDVSESFEPIPKPVDTWADALDAIAMGEDWTDL